MLKNRDIALATEKGLFFAKIDGMSLQLINQSFKQGKRICFQNEIETNEGYIVFRNFTDGKLCLADRVSGKCIDLYNEDGYISAVKYKDDSLIIARTKQALKLFKLSDISKQYIFNLQGGYDFAYSRSNDELQILISEDFGYHEVKLRKLTIEMKDL